MTRRMYDLHFKTIDLAKETRDRIFETFQPQTKILDLKGTLLNH